MPTVYNMGGPGNRKNRRKIKATPTPRSLTTYSNSESTSLITSNIAIFLTNNDSTPFDIQVYCKIIT